MVRVARLVLGPRPMTMSDLPAVALLRGLEATH
jgi:hypothetical protein